MRGILLLAGSLCLSACAWGPGMYMDEEGYREKHAVKDQPKEEQIQVVPIDAKLLARQFEQMQKERVKPKRDPLAQRAVDYDYRVMPHDVLSVTVWDHPELTIPAGEFRSPEATGYAVASDGTMFFPHVGEVEVAGKTLQEVRRLLTQRLTYVIERPQLDVRVAGFRGQKVQVTGEVVAPATIPITDVPLRVQDALSQAKGTTQEADLRNVTLTRGGQVFLLDMQSLYEDGDISQNWLLQDGDVLHVPDRSRNKVFVLGEVRAPRSRVMVKGRMTLAEAIGDSEGFDPVTSNPAKVYVIRGSWERPTVFKLDAGSPDALLLATHFELKPRDVVFVSPHNLTRWNRIISQIQPTVQLLYQSVDLVNRVDDIRFNNTVPLGTTTPPQSPP
ncbi:sugar ABC transporter substrate-binding protein [Aggregicoccus sp. 17bor-14]|uniref:polysaccharide export protein n=1 Tax=Myxococcaceae TaxID=31 RepID=UPI00129CAC3B|nr:MULTISPECIES: polysaccharide export protein [Myxococcaceae]MBF5043458.1 polysaccharide biosynthesis/export family protein [Simulacricoccus sp. 17bor-14]MRI89216.1 sugar ABC transporter substrate-binding protein [Aggregicoccus sp. 17bor-14]